ncbi:heme peroxidase [Crepidotus variabilis]|uniref:Heme peroxidase n=1 Tax=Crepidotus variabilis TaxID=179855 RepID=A0A9P6JL51_9AGAR|nr:heme peroxidase [Crepidotus variabilis]
MSSLIRRFAQKMDNLADSRAPLNLDGGRPVSGVWEKSTQEFLEIITKPAFTPSDLRAMYDLFRNSNSIGIDDRLLLLEKLIVFMSRYKDHEESKKCQQFVLSLLYKDLPHPPSSYLTTLPLEVSFKPVPQGLIKYQYRTADGSYTNPLIPSLGRAGTPYARSVASSNIGPKSTLPDPGLVFDTLLRRDTFTEHPGGISALFFAFADLVIHSIFNTRHGDWSINDASSYLDLSILYGSNEEQQNSVRRNDGSGKLQDDVWADRRLIMMPPSACVLLVLLNRNHNFIAQRLLDINENGKFVRNPTEDQKMLQDDEIFHRSRLVNCGYFMQIILGDYVGAILGLARDGTDWRLNPLMTMRDAGHEFCPTGQGNVVSIEFNLLYRWHATLSQPDTEWISGFFSKAFGGKDPSSISVEDFKATAEKRLSGSTPPSEWVFGTLKRNKETNRFDDAELAKTLHDAIETRAGAFKARGIPECLRVIEIMGIEQSRTWGTCSLNEFRKFLGLKPYKKFSEWNPLPEIHTAAAALYRDIDNLELHVGLQAEQPKEPGPGAGLCPGYTISRAILADAVCLTRGDRFLTTEFNPYNLTAWGYQDCQFDPQDGSYGGLLTKLLFRTLPDYFPAGSAYAHFPFLDPKFMQPEMMKENPDAAMKYTWSRPKTRSATVPVDDYSSVQTVLSSHSYLSASDSRTFAVVSPLLVSKSEVSILRLATISEKKKRYSLTMNRHEKAASAPAEVAQASKSPLDRLGEEERAANAVETSKKKLIAGVESLSKAILTKPEPDTAMYFSRKAVELIAQKSFAKVGSNMKCVDVVKDVINYLPIYWISRMLGLPLKTKEDLGGTIRDSALTAMMADIGHYVYLNFNTVDDWKLRESSRKTADEIIKIIEINVARVDSMLPIPDVLSPRVAEDAYSQSTIKKLWNLTENKCTHREFASQLFATVAPTAALYSQSLAHVVNFYLDKDKKNARDEIVKLIHSGEGESLKKALGYVYEALRLDPPIPGVYRTAARDNTLPATEVKAGTHVFASVVQANRDESTFGSEPDIPDYMRDPLKRGIHSFGISGLLTSEFFEVTMLASLAAIFSLKSLERGPGKSGIFIRFTEDLYGTKATKYVNLQGQITPWADSLLVQYID